MVKIQIKTGRVILRIPDLPVEATEEQKAQLDMIRKTLNMQKFGTFDMIISVVDDVKSSRSGATNPTGEFVRVSVPNNTYEINPFVVSEFKDVNGNILVPEGALPPELGGTPYYTASQMSEAFEANYF